jgi:polyisoprenyl-teichoic acid--peptidoglycan teichoic acid transferase
VKSQNKRPVQAKKSSQKVRKPAKPKGVRLVWLVFCLSGVAMLSATAGALLAVSLASTPLMQRQLTPAEESIFKQGDRFSSSSSVRLPELTRPVNILVMGVKVLTSDLQNPPEDKKNLGYHAMVNSFEGLTDTMLLLRFDPAKKKLAVLSIPRDTRTYIAEHGMTKINEANYYGGPALSAKSVSELLGGVGIDRYMTINVQGVQALIDALGGVTVHVPHDMKYQDDSQHLYINLKAGRQHLNGEKAQQLLRFRYDNKGDIGRIQRQQMVMRSLMEQALSVETVKRLPDILKVVQSHIDTNLTVEELLALVGFASQNRSNAQMLMVPGEFSAPGEYKASYWLPQPEKIQDLIAKHFDFGTNSLEEPAPSQLKIAIQDTVNQSKGLQLALGSLKDSGFTNTYETKAEGEEQLAVTRIVAEWGDVSSAEAVRRALGFGEVRIENTGDLSADVTIHVGRDALTPPKKLPAGKGAEVVPQNVPANGKQ